MVFILGTGTRHGHIAPIWLISFSFQLKSLGLWFWFNVLIVGQLLLLFSQQLLDRRHEFEQSLKANNCNHNKFDWETMITYNMENCYS